MKPTFKTLCDAAVTAGEMSEGTAQYFYDLFLQSAEHDENVLLRRAVSVVHERLHDHCLSAEREILRSALYG